MSIISLLIVCLYYQHFWEETISSVVTKAQQKVEELYLVILNAMWFGDICSNKTLFCSAMALCALLPPQSKEIVSLKTSPKEHRRFRKEISGGWLFPYLRCEHQACLWDLDIFIFNDRWGQEYKPAGGCWDSSSSQVRPHSFQLLLWNCLVSWWLYRAFPMPW